MKCAQVNKDTKKSKLKLKFNLYACFKYSTQPDNAVVPFLRQMMHSNYQDKGISVAEVHSLRK